jgi:glucose-6-phosphate isomerase
MIKIDNTHLKLFSEYKASFKTTNIFNQFKTHHQFLPMFKFEENLDKVLALSFLRNKVKNQFTDIVLLGTGGSSLGGQLLCKFSKLEDDIRIHFFDNIDPLTFKHFWEKNRLKTTLFLVISKSGTTPETLTQALISIARVEAEVGLKKLADHFIVITEPKPSPLKKLADQYGFMCIDHDQGIGGRFSGLSLVGLLPALLMGVPVDQVIYGAAAKFNEFLLQEEGHPIMESVSLMHQIMEPRKINQTILMTYVDQLEPLGRWFRQLWAESLGKNGLGSTPINAAGTVDQHSQLQLYLDGPKDKLFSIITHPLNWVGDRVSSEVSRNIGFDFMAGRTMGQLMNAEQTATIQVLKDNNCPTRVISISEVSPDVVGGLMMQFIIETILTADLTDVNCFDQPAVEQGKVLTKQILENQ